MQRQLRELVAHHLGDDLPPKPARGEHVGLVETPDGRGRVARQGQVGSKPRDALDLGARVGLRVQRVAVAVVFLPLAEVDAARQLADDGEVRAPAHVGLERGVLDQRGRREEARPEVPVRAHLFAQAEDALLRTDGARAPFGPSDGAEEHRVGRLGRFEGCICQGRAVGVDGALYIGNTMGVSLSSSLREVCSEKCIERAKRWRVAEAAVGDAMDLCWDVHHRVSDLVG